MDLEVVVEGVTDGRVVNETLRRVRQVWKESEPEGAWTVTVSPSETRGRWDLGVRGPSVRHFVSFPERAGQFPDAVAEQLRVYLARTRQGGVAGRCALANS
jgi:hypothetical protein